MDFVEVGFEIGVRSVDRNPERDFRATDERRLVRQRVGVINQTVVPDAKRETLINPRSLVVRLDPFDLFAAMRIERIVDELVEAFVRLFLAQKSRAKNAVGIAVL